MFGSLKQIILENPPWLDHEFAALSLVEATLNGRLCLSLKDAVQAKLASIDTSQSVELQRFVMWNYQQWEKTGVYWPASDEFDIPLPSQPLALLFDAYDNSISFQELNGLPAHKVLTYEVYHRRLRKLVLLNLIFDLIDRVVEYWNEVALARRAWRIFASAFRQLRETVLQFKPFHTPLRLFPSSIHPIESAA
jgi:hypothetical protein